ncbi:hypothetical protein KKC94_03005 [Patescibacteria group bacterium]|nr:hypothetical protein [Patescibacteria group bacterium]
MKYDPLQKRIQPSYKRKKRKPLSEEISQMYKILVVTLTVLGIATIFSYLYVNSLKPAKGYELKQLQLDYEELQSEKRDLERQIIDAQSFQNLETDEKIQEMNPAENDKFTFIEASPYAQNQ